MSRQGLNFLVELEGESVSIDLLAPELASALGVHFSPSEALGVPNGFVADALGMRLWLQIHEDRAITFVGEPLPPLEGDVEWVDIAPFMAATLTERTPRHWVARSG
jgi:hypothetical protein